MKRIVIISDLHSGHKLGLRKEEGYPWWEYYKTEIDDLKPIDACIVNGDAIEGKGLRSGGTELITSDRLEQVDMAEEIIHYMEAERYLFTYGTPAHVGMEEDFEKILADKFSASIKDRFTIRINGVVFDIKHKIASSSIPQGRFTALAKQKVWDLFWAETGERVTADIFVRSHVHYHVYLGGPSFYACTTPALQRSGTKYGAREMEGTVDFGFIHFDVEGEGLWTVKSHIARLESVSVVEL